MNTSAETETATPVSPHRAGHSLPLLLALLAGGCTTHVIPPPNPPDPVTVYLTDYGKHSSIVLPSNGGGFEEYAFGDWDYFARGKTGFLVALRAMIGSPQSTLGRRHIDAPPVPSLPAEFLGAQRIMSFPAARARVDALLTQLDHRFTSDDQPAIHSDHSNLYHVRDRERYWGGNNCNHVTAEWLRELGCEIRGPAIFSSFEVGKAGSSGPMQE